MTRVPRLLISALALAAIAAPSASAQAPLAGTGENIQPIAKIGIVNPNEVELAGDWAFVSSDEGGLVIVNIANPEKPFIEGKWDCAGGWADIDLSPDATLAILTNGHNINCLEEGGDNAAVLIDITDKKNPKFLSAIDRTDEIPYVHTVNLDNNLLYLNPQAAAFYPQGTEPHIAYFDISNRRAPVLKGYVESQGVGLAHDSYIDHRPDGKSLLYAASVHTTDVFDVTDPFKTSMLQRTYSPEITISHDVQPNHKRDIIVVDDEGAAGGQLSEEVSACGKVGGPGPAGYDSGSVHFYEAAPDGTFANGGVVELGSYNAPTNVATGACVAHVFWQAPDENRLTQAYYRTGGFILDFEDPANAKPLGTFVGEGGSNYWSLKPHRGYLFATDMEGKALHIMRYTGEGGTRWPATAGPAEIQRSARQGVPYKPLVVEGANGQPTTTAAPLPSAGPLNDNRSVGRIKFTAKVRKVAGKKGKKTTLTLVFRDAKKKVVGVARVKKAAGRKAAIKVVGGAVAGRYTYVVKAGKKTLKKGRLTVRKTKGFKLSPSKSLSVSAR